MTEGRDVIARLFDEAWNQGRLDVIDELVAEDLVGHGGAAGLEGSEALGDVIAQWRETFTDLHHRVDDWVGDGECIATRWSATGTLREPFEGIEPHGQAFDYSGITIWRLAEGRIAEAWVYNDLPAALERMRSR